MSSDNMTQRWSGWCCENHLRLSLYLELVAKTVFFWDVLLGHRGCGRRRIPERSLVFLGIWNCCFSQLFILFVQMKMDVQSRLFRLQMVIGCILHHGLFRKRRDFIAKLNDWTWETLRVVIKFQ